MLSLVMFVPLHPMKRVKSDQDLQDVVRKDMENYKKICKELMPLMAENIAHVESFKKVFMHVALNLNDLLLDSIDAKGDFKRAIQELKLTQLDVFILQKVCTYDPINMAKILQVCTDYLS